MKLHLSRDLASSTPGQPTACCLSFPMTGNSRSDPSRVEVTSVAGFQACAHSNRTSLDVTPSSWPLFLSNVPRKKKPFPRLANVKRCVYPGISLRDTRFRAADPPPSGTLCSVGGEKKGLRSNVVLHTWPPRGFRVQDTLGPLGEILL